ncbi:hypothetical protein [Deinococcus sp.]|uniref:hypothetical protein n=1 Tax=Deinococcus sp. TaxID=47478 RepID=UPI003C7BCE9B
MNSRPFLVAALAGICVLSPALAGGNGAKRSPFGVPYSDTVTLHCRSGRSILFFYANTQFVQLFYRGRVVQLTGLATTRDIRYSNVGLPSMGQFDKPLSGPGLEWRSTVKSGFMWKRSELYRALQHPGGQRTLTLLERCED